MGTNVLRHLAEIDEGSGFVVPLGGKGGGIADVWGDTMRQRDDNRRLILAAWNAMQSAAARLGVDPVELAEALADGGVAELVECLTGCTSCAPQLLNMPIGKRSGAALASIPAGKGGGA